MITTTQVHDVIARHQLADGLPIVADLDKSHGVWLHDALSGEDFLDAFNSFAAWPIGFNHPRMSDPDYRTEVMLTANIKIANADLYTREMAAFVETFATRVTPPGFPHHFWISGGSLAVENALKAAFDWKARKLGRTTYTDDVNDLVVVHLRYAFHGRSGYTLSLTNTSPEKIGLFPKFNWPRVHSPAIEFGPDGEIVNDVEAEERHARATLEQAFADHENKVAAIIAEPMQAEGGDRHFRPEFLRLLREFADRHEAMLIYDEVQTGFFASGTTWLWQQHDVKPDIVAFGKKAQICGIYASERIDEIPDNVFKTSSRINSTWGGSLIDMIRSRHIIGIIEQDNLAERTAKTGAHLVENLRALAKDTGAIHNVRGVGSLIAFTARDPDHRERIIKALYDRRALALHCGEQSVRFRLPLVMTTPEADELLERTADALDAAESGRATSSTAASASVSSSGGK